MTNKKLPADVVCHCKGACYPNPGGLMAYALAFYRPGESEPFYTDKGTKQDNREASNYRAYYHAIVISLETLLNQGYAGKVVELRTDLKGALNIIVFADEFMNSHQDLIDRIRELRQQFKKVRYVWVEKENIGVVDALAHEALTLFGGGAT